MSDCWSPHVFFQFIHRVLNVNIKLLTPPHNFAVCKMEDRNFPGVVMQGDSLFALIGLLERTLLELYESEEGPQSVIPDLEYEVEKLKSVLNRYELACKENGFGLPYVSPNA